MRGAEHEQRSQAQSHLGDVSRRRCRVRMGSCVNMVELLDLKRICRMILIGFDSLTL